jgi:class 3 adenylate cyclase
VSNPVQWRCFHCGVTFTKQQGNCAREHFGRDESATPVCLIRSAFRNAEDQLARYRNEDSDAIRAMSSMQSDRAIALRREEEKGYERWLRYAQKMSWEEATT